MENKSVNTSDKIRFKALISSSYIAIGSDIFLILLKLALLYITGSVIFQADAFHSGADLAVSLTVLLSLSVKYKFASKPIAKEAEAFVSLIIAALLFFGGLSIISNAINTDSSSFVLNRGISLILALIGVSIACIVMLLIARFKANTGKKYDSMAFTAEGIHTFSDFTSSFGVWLTLIFGYFGIHIERIMTFIIGLFIIQLGIRLVLRVFGQLSFKTMVNSWFKKILPNFIVNLSKKVDMNKFPLYITFKEKIKTFISFLPDEESFFLHRRKLLLSLFIIIFLLYIGLGFYSVLPYQTGVEFLFGKVIKENHPGLHYCFPEPLGKVIKVDTGVAARVECGFRTNWNEKIEEPDAYLWEFSHTDGRFVKVIDEALAITGDENVIDANFLCYFHIVDPVKFAVQTKDALEILRTVFMREIHGLIGKYRIESLLTSKRGQIQEKLAKNMKKISEIIDIGVRIDNVYMQEVHPPIDVVPDYRAVASAREKKNEIIHKANGYANDIIPRSRGKGEKKVLEAETYKKEKMSQAEGIAESFLLREVFFRKSPALQIIRLRWNIIESLFFGRTIYIIPSESRRRFYLSGKFPNAQLTKSNGNKEVSDNDEDIEGID